ncbi:MAG TPA: sensor histidine kinase [Candidatus Paceibacterota bacterium]|nr:sensor histidine kinase [Candidatus Paceibacterota bacterium]
MNVMATPTNSVFKGKLRNKIFLFMALIGIVPLVTAAALTYYVVTKSHRDDVAKVEAAVLTQTGDQIQSFINNNILTQTSVEIPFGGNIFATSSIPAQQYVLSQTLATLPFLQSEAYVNLAGMETASADRSDLSGSSSSSLQDVSASPAFQAAKAGNNYLGPVAYAGGVPTVSFASPVKDANDETIGVITGVATLGELQNIVASATIGNTGYLYLVDQNGIIMAGGGSFGSDIGNATVADFPMVQKVIGGNSALTAAAQMRYKNAFGQNVVAAGEPLSENGQYWGLVAEWPTSESDAVINALLLRDAIVLLVVLGLIVLFSIVLALIIVRPIKKMEVGAARVAQGKFDEGVSITTGDELQELGNSFNDMVMGLKQLEQLKDEFVFIAAHELRTPVAAMKGYLELILEGTTGAIPDATRVFIEKVIASNQRLIQLVNDLLEVARSQAGRLTIKVAPIDIAPPIVSTLDELKSLADEKSVTMTYLPPADLPQVLADADRVKEVVVNLVGNAIKYMGGAGTITVTHEVVAGVAASVPGAAAAPAMLVTHITDTGLGISAAAQEKLFEKFYRVQTDKTKDITGTGLGLFIVKEIIEKMGGTISVTSEEGKGSTFSFALQISG